jgi:RNA polymerase sigma-70 factor (ECF subfamily)
LGFPGDNELKAKNYTTKKQQPPAVDLVDFAALFEQHQLELLRTLYGMVGEIETARDLAQETFARGYRWWLERTENDSAEVEWRPLLFKIATNCALDWLRRQNKFYFSPLPDSGEVSLYSQANPAASSQWDDPAEQTEVRLAVLATLRGLDSASAICLLLYYDQGFSCPEIATITGENLPAIWQRLSRARRLFCNLYQKEQAFDV